MRPNIYISYVERMFFSNISTQILDWARASWGRRENGEVVEHPNIITTFDLRHDSPVEKFNRLADADIFIVVCPPVGWQDENLDFELKVMAALFKLRKRLVYAIIKVNRDWCLYKADFVAGKLREITEDTK